MPIKLRERWTVYVLRMYGFKYTRRRIHWRFLFLIFFLDA
jgi:hypothetical protein